MLCASTHDPDRAALVGTSGSVSYGEVVERVERRAIELDLGERSLVVLSGDNSVEWVVSYLALVRDGHVPILAPRSGDQLASTWRAQATLHVDGDSIDLRRTGVPAAELHPELALLASTSGSTGGPKLVRLSHRNLVANAEAIASYLDLTADDRAITALPLHYCYGLSVLHTHLLVGGSVVVTDGSVVDRCFRTAMVEHGVTTFAGVPHTYEMLDRIGPESIRSPLLRQLTQAGGPMAPTEVARWVRRADDLGARFFVMYGQTEATARIAYLPPSVAARRPDAIGVPVPGGSLEIEPVDGQAPDVGELVYTGPNVMMGYAVEPADLARGHELERLRTGDLGRYHADDGVFEIVGRRARFVKPFGLRIDLDDVQRRAEEAVATIAVTGDDDRIVAFAPDADVAGTTALVAGITGLPNLCVQVHDAPIPRTSSGKIDHGAMLAASWTPAISASTAAATEGPEGAGDAHPADSSGVAELFGAVLGRGEVGPDDTFVSLGGDSLSYVECSIRLERELGSLPSDWHLRPVRELASATTPRRRLARLDTTVALRALAICLVVATHMRVAHVPGGAHTLLAVAGYNLARFMAPLPTPFERLRAGLRTAARAAVPTMIWVGVGMVAFGSYSLGTLLLVNNYVGPASHAGDQWHFWFIEVFVHLVVAATLLLAIPRIGRLDQRFAYSVPAVLLAAALVLRMDWAHMDDWYNLRFRTHGVAWFFVLGWLIQRSRTVPQRMLTTLVVLAVVPGFFRIADRDWRIAALLIALVWIRDVPFPRPLVRPVGVLAAASMWIYVSHFSIWPLFDRLFVREVAYVLTIAAGVAVWFAAERALGSLNNRRQARPRSPLRLRATTTTPVRGFT